MHNLLKAYAEFERLVDEENVYEERGVTFSGICRRIHISPCELNEVIVSELGITGDELLESYHNFLRFVSFEVRDLRTRV